jgi:predicted Zn-dependent protease
MRRLVAGLMALALAVPPAGLLSPAGHVHAQALPELGDISQAKLSLTQERKLGETIVREARARGGILNDPEVNDYLNELGNRLVAAAPDGKQDFEFFAVPDGAINAFALPGGYVGINTGLILLAQSESELASVLAHEITHVTQRHIARQLQGQQDSLLMSLAALAAAVLASKAGGASSGEMAQAAIMTSQAVALQNQLNYTREFEFEADRIGFQRLVEAGFDPRAGAVFMERLQRGSRFVEGTAPSYLRTHPITYERIAEAQSRADALPYRQVADSIDFHMVRALLRSYVGEAHEAVAYFDNALAQKMFNNEIAVRYGLVASLLRARDMKRARVELERLEREAPAHPMIAAIGAHVLMESGDYDAAIRRLEAALTRYPNKMQLVYDHPDALLRAGRSADAAAAAERALQRFPGDGMLHRRAAQAYAALDRKTRHHYHQGEYYAYNGNLRGAVAQMELAVKANDADFYEYSVVETRLRALRRELVEQQKEALARNG